MCGDPQLDFLAWQEGLDPLQGVDASFFAALVGPCTVSDRSDEQGPDFAVTTTVVLDCTFDGRIDGQTELSGEAMQITTGFTRMGADIGLQADQDVQVRFVAQWWGMGWDRWLVVESDTGALLVDAVAGEYADPDATTNAAVAEVFGTDPWHGSFVIGTEESGCPVSDECNAVARAMSAAWDGLDGVTLDGGHTADVPTPLDSAQYRFSVGDARAWPEPACTDLPVADYRAVLWQLQ